MINEKTIFRLLRKASNDLTAAKRTKCPITRQLKITSANQILRIFLDAAKEKAL